MSKSGSAGKFQPGCASGRHHVPAPPLSSAAIADREAAPSSDTKPRASLLRTRPLPTWQAGVTEGRGVAATRGPATAGTFAPARCSSLKDPDLKRQALQPSWLSAACGRRVRDLRCAPEPGRQLYDFGFQDSLLTNPPCTQPKRTVPTPKTTSLATHKTFQPVVRPRSVSWVLPPSEKKACSVIPGRRSKTT